ncbi:Os07g0132700, partial [Oryza sativa Japonica Group]
SLLLRCSCKLVNNPWKDNINLCSILDMHRPTAKWSPLPEKTKIVKVPDQVKSAIVAKLRSSKGSLQLTKACTASLHLQGSDSQLLWEDVTATTDVLLVCHIATTILEATAPTWWPAVPSCSPTTMAGARTCTRPSRQTLAVLSPPVVLHRSTRSWSDCSAQAAGTRC